MTMPDPALAVVAPRAKGAGLVSLPNGISQEFFQHLYDNRFTVRITPTHF
jgi:hypothetical protein